MATVRETVDAAFATLLQAMEGFQESHFVKHGKFRQMTRTHKAPPGAAAKGNADRKLAKRGEGDWADVGIDLGKASRFACKVDTIASAKGQAWVMTVEFAQGGETWRKSVRRGVGAQDGEWGKV